MVSKKYLCSAPNPSTWDDHAESLLKSLGGDIRKREEIVQRTLAALGETSEEKKRSGPGRRSNAEHAISFYRYVLTLNKNEGKEDKSDTSSKISHLSENGSLEGDDEKEEDLSTASILSMDSQEFLDQHNDLCEVCNIGGDLLCCSTCNLVFHLKCTRPHLKQIPPDNWSCSYCVASGLTGYKREARTRRRAASAVRLMNRLRKEAIERNKATGRNEENGGGTNKIVNNTSQHQKKKDDKGLKIEEEIQKERSGDLKSEEKEIESSNLQNSIEIENNHRKRKFEEVATFDFSEELFERRRRRVRKQPTLYDPQDCPASEWQSDGCFEWRIMSASETGIPEEKDTESMNADRSQYVNECREKKEGTTGDEPFEKPVWCNFCKDNPAIPMCCFCACRACFGKHDGSKLLLCDRCDDEYHTYCLDPPLNNVPTTQKWYCARCQALIQKEKSDLNQVEKRRLDFTRVESDSPTKISSRIPPPKNTVPNIAEKIKISSRSSSNDRQNSLTDFSESSKRVGKIPSSDDKIENNEVFSTEKKPRGKIHINTRGKTGKVPSEKSVSPAKPSSSDAKRVKGQPPNKKPTPKLEAAPSEKRGRGRPRKYPTSLTAKNPVIKGPIAKSPVVNSTVRRGRPQKGAKLSTDGKKDMRSVKTGKIVEEVIDKKNNTNESSIVKQTESSKNSKLETCSSSSWAMPVQRSRSGRMVKPSVFHDEMYEGDQNLRSLKMFGSVWSDKQKSQGVRKKAEASGNMVESSVTPNVKANKVDTAVTTGETHSKIKSKTTTSSQVQLLPTKVQEQENQDLDKSANKPGEDLSKESINKKIESHTPKPTTKKTVAVVKDEKDSTSKIATSNLPSNVNTSTNAETPTAKTPRRKPGARECMQISRRFGAQVIPEKYMDTLLDYCSRGKVEHLIRMRERLDDHSRFLEAQLAGLEALVKEKGETDIRVPVLEKEENVKQTHASPTLSCISPPSGENQPTQTTLQPPGMDKILNLPKPLKSNEIPSVQASKTPNPESIVDSNDNHLNTSADKMVLDFDIDRSVEAGPKI